MLEHTGHITAISTHDTLGRPAIKITFTDEANRPGEDQALLFDPDTSAILEETTVAPDLTFTATYTGASTVDAVPADVLSKAVDPEKVPKGCTSNCPTPGR